MEADGAPRTIKGCYITDAEEAQALKKRFSGYFQKSFKVLYYQDQQCTCSYILIFRGQVQCCPSPAPTIGKMEGLNHFRRVIGWETVCC